jgi:hypothetical protein
VPLSVNDLTTAGIHSKPVPLDDCIHRPLGSPSRPFVYSPFIIILFIPALGSAMSAGGTRALHPAAARVGSAAPRGLRMPVPSPQAHASAYRGHGLAYCLTPVRDSLGAFVLVCTTVAGS